MWLLTQKHTQEQQWDFLSNCFCSLTSYALGELVGTKHGMVHSGSTENTVLETPKSRENIRTSKSIFGSFIFSILHYHLLIQKDRYLCTEQLTATMAIRQGWAVILTGTVNVSTMRQIPQSNWKAVKLDTHQRVKMNQDTAHHAMCYIWVLPYVQGLGRVRNLSQVLLHMDRMLPYANGD